MISGIGESLGQLEAESGETSLHLIGKFQPTEKGIQALTAKNQKDYEFDEDTGNRIMKDIENLFSLGDKPK